MKSNCPSSSWCCMNATHFACENWVNYNLGILKLYSDDRATHKREATFLCVGTFNNALTVETFMSEVFS